MTSEGIVQIVAIKDGAGTEKRLMKDIKDVNYIKKDLSKFLIETFLQLCIPHLKLEA